jgi:hypothetical protein
LDPNGDIITFDPTVFDNPGVAITPTQGEITIAETTQVLIDGTTGGGTLGVTIEAPPYSHIFKIENFTAAPTIELKGLTLTGAQAGSGGGAIDTIEDLIVRDSIYTCSQGGQEGGGIRANGAEVVFPVTMDLRSET